MKIGTSLSVVQQELFPIFVCNSLSYIVFWYYLSKVSPSNINWVIQRAKPFKAFNTFPLLLIQVPSSHISPTSIKGFTNPFINELNDLKLSNFNVFPILFQ